MQRGRKTWGITGAIGGLSLAVSGIGFASPAVANEPTHSGFTWASDGSLSSEQLFLGAVVDRSLAKLAWASTAIGSASMLSSSQIATIRARIDAAESAVHVAAAGVAAATSMTQLDAAKTVLFAALKSAHAALSEVARVFAADRLSAKASRIGGADGSVAGVPADVAAAEAAADAAATAAAAGDTSAALADLLKAKSEIKAALAVIRAAALAASTSTTNLAALKAADVSATDFRSGGCDHHFSGAGFDGTGWHRYDGYRSWRDGDHRWRR